MPVAKKKAKKKPTKKAGPALRITANGKVITCKKLIKKRFKVYGFGTFLENINKGDISITKAALDLILSCEFQRGIQGMEIFSHAPHVLAWGAPVDEIQIHKNHISLHDDAETWFEEVSVVQEEEP